MTASRYAVIANGVVMNVILWDDATPYTSADGTELVAVPETVSIGWERIEGEWVAPDVPEPEPVPVPEDDPAKLAAVSELMSTLGISEASARAIAGLPPVE